MTNTTYKSLLINYEQVVTVQKFTGDKSSLAEIIAQSQAPSESDLIEISKKINSKYPGYNIDLGIEYKIVIDYPKQSYITATYIIDHNDLDQPLSDFIVFPLFKAQLMTVNLEQQIARELNLILRNGFLKAKPSGILSCDLLLNEADAFKFLHEILSHTYEADFQIKGLEQLQVFNNGFSMFENIESLSPVDHCSNKVITNVPIIEDGIWTGVTIGADTGNIFTDWFSTTPKYLPRATAVKFVPKQSTEFKTYPYCQIEKIGHGFFDYHKLEFFLYIEHATYYRGQNNYQYTSPFYIRGELDELRNASIFARGSSTRQYSLCGKQENARLISGDVSKLLIRNLKLEIDESIQ